MQQKFIELKRVLEREIAVQSVHKGLLGLYAKAPW